MAVEVIGTLKPKNGGGFPIAEAEDILMPDGTRLSNLEVSDGETPYIGENGNWWIGETDTGVPASASMPEVTEEDNDKILQVVNGAWAAVAVADSAVKTYVDDYISEALGGEY